MHPPATTPMLAQYLALKAQAPGCLLFYRMGDFYELFFEDASVAAAALDITLTARGQHNGEPVPMCGVPVHMGEAYLARLIRAGHRVAIAEQMEEPAAARKRGGPVARAIVRVVTPGTLTEAGLLDARASNHLAAVAPVGGRVGVAWCDVSTGGFWTSEVDAGALDAELARIDAAELVAPEGWSEVEDASALAPMHFRPATARERLCALFGVATLDGFGAFGAAEVAAAGALVAYLDLAGRGTMPRLDPPQPFAQHGAMQIDAATRASLELTRGTGGERGASLLAAIDMTLTGAGARLLGADLAAPLTDVGAIGERLGMVAWFVEESAARVRLRDALKATPDLERALGRLVVARGGPRDLALLRDGLARALEAAAGLRAVLVIDCPPLLDATVRAVGDHAGLVAALTDALAPDPAGDATQGRFIAAGYDPELDGLREAARDGRRLVAALETRLRGETGVGTLKVRHNNVLGYHIEVPARHGEALSARGFEQRQSLAGSVRFNSPELAELAARIAQASERAVEREAEHFRRLRAEVLGEADAIARTARALARLDVAAGLAELAVRANWARPQVDGSCAFTVTAGRHPVVEAALARARAPFVANDCDLSGRGRVWLLTGPNMAGKSTFLRQNALIAVLAQMGSFVPAASAQLGVVDRLFSRVGASDNLAAGRSTFMVEMVETAAILRQATERSLLILDEVGRGTSTYDGLAIAWSVLEHIHDVVRARCLFATHYHELTRLAERLEALALHTVRVREWRGELVFLHEVAPGAADRSYGLAVAKLAGVPAPVLARARTILDRLEAQRPALQLAGDLPLFAAAAAEVAQARDPLRERLAPVQPDALAPREALELIYELKALAPE